MRQMKNAYKIMVGKPEGKRPRHRREDSIRMDLREIEWEGIEWIHLAQDRDQKWGLMNTVTNLPVS
jgi:hypothetical protein